MAQHGPSKRGTQTDNCCARRKSCQSHPRKPAHMWVGVPPPLPDAECCFIAEERALETKGTAASLPSSRNLQPYNTQYLFTPLTLPARALEMQVFPF